MLKLAKKEFLLSTVIYLFICIMASLLSLEYAYKLFVVFTLHRQEHVSMHRLREAVSQRRQGDVQFFMQLMGSLHMVMIHH